MAGGKNDAQHKATPIPIGIGTQLQIKVGGVEERLKSVLIGMEVDEYLVMIAPVSTTFGSITQKFYEGNKITVQYLHGGTVFGFYSKIIGAINSPRKLLFVEYPNSVEKRNVRTSKRVDCLLPATIEIHKKAHLGVIRDISEGGCLCLIRYEKDKTLPSARVNSHISLRFQLPGVDGEKSALVEIRGVKLDIEGKTFGLRFLELAPEARHQIGEFISYAEA